MSSKSINKVAISCKSKSTRATPSETKDENYSSRYGGETLSNGNDSIGQIGKWRHASYRALTNAMERRISFA